MLDLVSVSSETVLDNLSNILAFLITTAIAATTSSGVSIQPNIVLPRVLEIVPAPHKEKTIEEKVRAAFLEDADTAVRVMMCESLASTTVISKTNDYGLFQINKYAHGIGDEMLDVDTNIAYARKLYDARGWADWYMSRHCWEK